MFGFYKPVNNPNGLTGAVGGVITTHPLSGYLGELFAHVEAPPSGIDGVYQYRKLYVVNEYAGDSIYTRIWIDQADHPEQLSIALETGTQTTSSPTISPTGTSSWQTPTNYANGVEIGTLEVGAATGIWIRQYLTGIIEDDPFASARLYVGGIIQ